MDEKEEEEEEDEEEDEDEDEDALENSSSSCVLSVSNKIDRNVMKHCRDLSYCLP